MSDVVQRTSWPKRLWTPAKIRYATTFSPDEIVALIAEQSQGYAAPRDGNLSKIGYRIEVTSRGFKLFKVGGQFLGNPPRTIAVLDATTWQTRAGTLIEGDVRLPYQYVVMFSAFWVATIGAALLPTRAIFVGIVVLWGVFGSLFALAQRADAGRSVSTFVTRLETALGAPLVIPLDDVGIPTQPHPPLQPVSGPLFRNRLQAGIFLGGVTAFWGGFLLFGLLHRTSGLHPAPGGQSGPAELAVLALILSGGLLVGVAQRGLLVRMTNSAIPTSGAMMRTVMPGTLSDAARTLGLNGPVVAGALYLVLVVGIVAFFTALTAH